MSKTRDLGNLGEAETARYLRKRGCTLLASQWRCRFGEIDLIARERKTICFVEVKLRGAHSPALPREFVDRRKQERLRTAAACWLSTNDLTDAPARFDVAEVYVDENGRVLRMEYLEDAFS